ncbi:MAG: hypothetical protein JW981_10285 [Anaerolineae bacterium]|nr:hypothetical protein [Anaerolineae bacterium]
MLTIQKIDPKDKGQVRRFVQFPFHLYAGHPQWVPPLRGEVEVMLDPNRHPFYEHSYADSFIALRDAEVVGRIMAIENTSYNKYHDTQQAQFYLFECEDDKAVAEALFDRAFAWARERGLKRIVGPKCILSSDGYGILVKGFEHRQTMTMMNYNYPYYSELLEGLGFEKAVDFVSCYFDVPNLKLPERIHRIAERVKQRESLQILQFKNKGHLKSWIGKLGQTYNKTFVNNWEYYPLTQNEIDFVFKDVATIADYRLFKMIVHGDDIVGFLLGFPDISAALQRANGRLMPWSIADILLELRRTNWISLNGAGILPEFQGIGGNALLYAEMEKTVHSRGFEHAEFTQVAESATQMQHDLVNVGGELYKLHRVYQRDL